MLKAPKKKKITHKHALEEVKGDIFSSYEEKNKKPEFVDRNIETKKPTPTNWKAEDKKAAWKPNANEEEFTLTKQEQLLIEVNDMKNGLSFFSFLAGHVEMEEVLNCKGTKEKHDASECEWKAGMS